MKTITYNIKKFDSTPMCHSFSMYPSQKEMKKEIEEYGEVIISVEKRTKTTLDISMSSRNVHSFSVAHIPSGAEHLKFHHVSSDNYFQGHRELDYFKLTKKQGMNELKYYIERVIDELNIQRQDLYVDMYIYDIAELEC